MTTFTSAILTAVKDFPGFLRNPDDVQINVSPARKVAVMLVFLLVELALTFTIIIPVLSVIDEAVDLQYKDYESLTFLQTLLSAVFFAPCAEELIFRYFLRYNGLKTRLISKQNWDAIFPVLVYLSALCFAAVHIFNYNNNTALFYYLAPLIVFSQLLSGLIITYLRVRFDFIWGLLFHCTWNLIVVLVSEFV